MQKVKKTYGKIYYHEQTDEWQIVDAQPHVCIKLKAVFTQVHKNEHGVFKFKHNPLMCRDLLWFMLRYRLEISPEDYDRMSDGEHAYNKQQDELEFILLPDYTPAPIELKPGFSARPYQLKGNEMYQKAKRLLIGDELGTGKTIIGILSFMSRHMCPGMVVVQPHLVSQWKGQIQRFTNLRVHAILRTKLYDLPEADVYIVKYNMLTHWIDVFKAPGFINSIVFDEVQELRHEGTQKYDAASRISKRVEYVLGLSASPIYNYGDEIYNVLNVIKPGCLGDRTSFMREWMKSNRGVHDPEALGMFLKDNYLMLRRTRKDIGKELPPINKIVHTVDYDHDEVDKANQIARTLAIRTTMGSFMERGQAARELDIFVRQSTGIAKARQVAEYIRILLENNEPVLLAGWHRDVYDIWKKELAEFNPVLFTGSESPAQKERNKTAFINGDTNLMIISLRSGIGLDGLQKRCKTVVFGELDWSPKVHDQVIGRVDREGQEDQVTAIYLISDQGSDPLIIDMLGLKASQSHNIIDPLIPVPAQYSDESRLKLLAELYLKKMGKKKIKNKEK